MRNTVEMNAQTSLNIFFHLKLEDQPQLEHENVLNSTCSCDATDYRKTKTARQLEQKPDQ